jgi:hypothetical protein
VDWPCAAAELERRQGAVGGITKAGHQYLRQMLIVGAIWAMMASGERYREPQVA